jgi:hypothetical protein
MLAYIINLSWLHSFFLPKVFSRGEFLPRKVFNEAILHEQLNNIFFVSFFVFVVNSVI